MPYDLMVPDLSTSEVGDVTEVCLPERTERLVPGPLRDVVETTDARATVEVMSLARPVFTRSETVLIVLGLAVAGGASLFEDAFPKGSGWHEIGHWVWVVTATQVAGFSYKRLMVLSTSTLIQMGVVGILGFYAVLSWHVWALPFGKESLAFMLPVGVVLVGTPLIRVVEDYKARRKARAAQNG